MNGRLAFHSALSHSILLALGTLGAACGDTAAAGGGAQGGEAQGGAAQGGAAEGGSARGGEAEGGSAQGGAGQGGEAQGGAAQGGAPEGGAPGASNVERCFFTAEPCPEPAEASLLFGSCTDTGELVTQWISGPTLFDKGCCYQVDVTAPNNPGCGGVGRPLIVGETVCAAPIQKRSGWSASPAVRVTGLAPETRARLAEAWTRDGAYEHASIASFGKLALELIAFGAPSDLIEAVHVAALDEVRHARTSLGFAAAYAGTELGPLPLPALHGLALADSLETLAAAAVREGCCGETLAAMVAFAQAEAAQDPTLRQALETIANEEAAHAALAYRVVAWAIRAGGESVRAVARQAAHDELAILARETATVGERDDELLVHGRLSAARHLAERQRGAREVVVPSLRALLGAPFEKSAAA